MENTATEATAIPTIVLEINGGLINCVRSSVPVRVVVLDSDTDGADEDGLKEVLGDEYYVTDYDLSSFGGFGMDGVDPEFVSNTLAEIGPDSADLPEPNIQDEIAVGKSGKLVTLDGEEIVGTYERLYGAAGINFATRQEDGTLEFEHDGGTDVYWDDQKTVKVAGERLFVTDSGNTVPESQVKLVPADDEDDEEETE